MDHELTQTKRSFLLTIIAWGSAWGIVEAVMGYLLHMLPFNAGWLIWYPLSCFFMVGVYRKTHRTSSVLMIGILCACIKMLNLFLPGSVDRVINPAVSIVLEALAMALMIYVLERFYHKDQKSPFVKALVSLGMNTAWRLLFILYLIFLVPAWMRGLSVISSADQFIAFFVTQNLITSICLLLGYLCQDTIFRPFEVLGNKITAIPIHIPSQLGPVLKTTTVMIMLCLTIALQFL